MLTEGVGMVDRVLQTLAVQIIPLAMAAAGAWSRLAVNALGRRERLEEAQYAFSSYLLTGLSLFACPLSTFIALERRAIPIAAEHVGVFLVASALFLSVYVIGVLRYLNMSASDYKAKRGWEKFVYRFSPMLLILLVLASELTHDLLP